jgi:hypothetical protein
MEFEFIWGWRWSLLKLWFIDREAFPNGRYVVLGLGLLCIAIWFPEPKESER